MKKKTNKLSGAIELFEQNRIKRYLLDKIAKCKKRAKRRAKKLLKPRTIRQAQERNSRLPKNHNRSLKYCNKRIGFKH
jgi:hypothetical protein